MLAKLVSPQRERGEAFTGQAKLKLATDELESKVLQLSRGKDFNWWNGPHRLICTGFNSRSCQVILSWFVQEAALAAETSGDQLEKPGPPCVPANRMSSVLVIDLWLVFALLEESGNGTFARSGWAVSKLAVLFATKCINCGRLSSFSSKSPPRLPWKQTLESSQSRLKCWPCQHPKNYFLYQRSHDIHWGQRGYRAREAAQGAGVRMVVGYLLYRLG